MKTCMTNAKLLNYHNKILNKHKKGDCSYITECLRYKKSIFIPCLCSYDKGERFKYFIKRDEKLTKKQSEKVRQSIEDRYNKDRWGNYHVFRVYHCKKCENKILYI